MKKEEGQVLTMCLMKKGERLNVYDVKNDKENTIKNNHTSFYFLLFNRSSFTSSFILFSVRQDADRNEFRRKSMFSIITIISLLLFRFILFYFNDLSSLFFPLVPIHQSRNHNHKFDISLFNHLPNITIKGVYFNSKGEMKAIEIFTRKERKIMEIKREISLLINREIKDIKEIRLVVNGHTMSDNHSLNHYYLSSSSKVFILPLLTGGGKGDKKKNNNNNNNKKNQKKSSSASSENQQKDQNEDHGGMDNSCRMQYK